MLKLAARILFGILGILVIIVLGSVIFEAIYPFPLQIKYGVTFSPGYAQFLKLDWKETYIKMLDELKIRNIRLTGYWDVIEKNEGQYDFSKTDYLLDEAGKRSAQVILVLGERQPRWPECQIPVWAKQLKLEDRRQRVLKFIQKTVERYNNNPAIWAWQVENEPFLSYFGEGCDLGDKKFLQKEVDLVKSFSKKTIIVSDSGELGAWILPMQASDIFGTTLYRTVYNPVMGYFSYPVLPYLYNIKSQIVRIFAPHNKKTIIIELQAEPWLADSKYQGKALEQAKLFPLDKFKSYTKYAQKTGFDEMYLWGVEWWFWMGENGYPEYLDYAKSLFR